MPRVPSHPAWTSGHRRAPARETGPHSPYRTIPTMTRAIRHTRVPRRTYRADRRERDRAGSSPLDHACLGPVARVPRAPGHALRLFAGGEGAEGEAHWVAERMIGRI